MEKVITNSEKETFDFAKKLSKELKGGEIFGLIGNLGAGKTIFSKGLAKGLNVKENVTSPTFTLMKIYKVNGFKKIKKFIHIDAYRLKSFNDLISIGAEEYFDKEDVVVAIEWANKIKKILPKKTKFLKIN